MITGESVEKESHYNKNQKEREIESEGMGPNTEDTTIGMGKETPIFHFNS